MPLYSENGERAVDECLGTVISRAVLYDGDSGAGSADGLVVGTVYRCPVSAEGIQPASRDCDDSMVLVAVSVFVQSRRREILYDCAAEADIDDLHTLADAENGKPAADTQLKRLQLQDVKLRVNGAGAVVAFSEKGGSNVASAGQDQCVTACDFPDIQCDYRLKTSSSYIADVIARHFISTSDCYFHGNLKKNCFINICCRLVL